MSLGSMEEIRLSSANLDVVDDDSACRNDSSPIHRNAGFASAEGRDGRDTYSVQRRPSKNRGNTSGVIIDLSQTWQRSLLRQLNHVDDYINGGADMPPDKLLLGRTESADFALPIDDDFTLDTETSSTVPTRMQMIHRMVPQRHEALFYDEDDEDDAADRNQLSSPDSRDELASDILTQLREQHNSPRQDFSDELQTSPSPRDLLQLRRESYQRHEIENEEIHVIENEPSQPNCGMCFGYDGVLDFLLPPRRNGSPYRTHKRRSSYVPRGGALPKVDEEIDIAIRKVDKDVHELLYSTSRVDQQY